MKMTISALDTLTFGVGKPSVWGEDTFGAGMFPPFPSVVRGAVRAGWLYENGSFDMAGTETDTTRDYRVTEYALLLNGMPHFPVPADILWSENGDRPDGERLIQCKLIKSDEEDGLSSLTAAFRLTADTDDTVAPAEGRYISLENLTAYLHGETVTESVPLDDYVTRESKIGIYRGRDTGTVKTGMLYRSPLTRLKHGMNTVTLAANIEGAERGGLIRFGGENKVANFTAYDGTISPRADIDDNGRFKLYLATPGIFVNGHEPKLPVQSTLLTAAVNGYDSVGGFDMKERHPKPMRRAVRAGSVYYYELVENNAENRAAILALHGGSVSGYSREDGFGICYIGRI